MKWVTSLLAAATLLAPASLRADVVLLDSGREVECLVLEEQDRRLVLKIDYGTVTYPRSLISEIRRGATTRPVGQTRIPCWRQVLGQALRQPWGDDLQQVDADVIDEGVLANVPYQSYRCTGGQIEINLYGDPDRPACVEIGLRGPHAREVGMQANALAFLASLMRDAPDADAFRALDRDGQRIAWWGLTMLVLPEQSDGSDNAWWASVYDPRALDAARADEAEMRRIARPANAPTLVRGEPVRTERWEQSSAASAAGAFPRIFPTSGKRSVERSQLGFAMDPHKYVRMRQTTGRRVYVTRYCR